MVNPKLLTLRLLVLAGSIFTIDQITKYAIRTTIEPFNIKELITNTVYLTNSSNTGLLLGFLSGTQITVVLVNLIVLSTILVLYYRQKIAKYNTELILLFGAGLSNLYDRLALEAVIDWIGISNFSIFNIADIIITIAITSIIIRQTLKETQKTRSKLYKKIKKRITQ